MNSFQKPFVNSNVSHTVSLEDLTSPHIYLVNSQSSFKAHTNPLKRRVSPAIPSTSGILVCSATNLLTYTLVSQTRPFEFDKVANMSHHLFFLIKLCVLLDGNLCSIYVYCDFARFFLLKAEPCLQ